VRTFAFAVTLLCGLASAPPVRAQSLADSDAVDNVNVNIAETAGQRMPTQAGTRETSDDIAIRQALTPPSFEIRPKREHEIERDRVTNPAAPNVSSWPIDGGNESRIRSLNAPQSVGISFDGATLDDTHAFPPDTMGAVGPSQYVTFVNGRVRTFTKAGVADGVINADSDVFFASVMTPLSASIVANFTSDPQVRYDRFSARWFLSIIDVPCKDSSCGSTAANRWLLAVSNGPTITASTVWTFFYVLTDTSSFCDYPSLGIDVNALYFGCNVFTSAGSFGGTTAFVVQKASALGAGPLVATKFTTATATGAGPYAPRGVDNLDPNATVGYFVGSDNAVYSAIDFRVVSNPGSTTPTLGANIQVTVPTTTSPSPVEHKGNTGGNNGRLDSLDDRLFAAMIRNNHLWTAHNLRVGTTGTASTGSTARKASRWYDFAMNGTSAPTLNQSGTVYDNAATLAAAAQYWIPTISANGQGHAVIGFSMAGTNYGATPAYTGRLAGDALGTMAGVPGTSVTPFGTSAASYNPTRDTGGASGRRWGDYSFTMVDPLDDMTIWTTQEYNNAASSALDSGGNYAARVGQLLAPPPATPSCSTTPIDFAGGTGNVTITATSVSGSGFYDPGADLPSPALPFKHLHATITNGTVNSATYTSPTSVTLNVTASAAGLHDVTITNPDGQSVTATGCINVAGGTTAYTIGGAVGGLTGSNTVGLKLTDTTSSTSQTIASQANGSFTFGTALTAGHDWSVTIATQPTGQTCSVTNGSGTNLSGNVSTVQVTCTTNTYTIGGAVGGLTGSNTVGLKLTDTTSSTSQTIASQANGNFTFGTALNFGDGWNVTVATQPTGQTCSVTNGSGTNLSGNVTNVSVTCTTNTYTIGGAVGGLTGSNTVGLKLTDTTSSTSQTIASQANGNFTFGTALTAGHDWSVTVATQPTGQTCSVTNGSGTNLSGNVTNVSVTCTTNTYTIGGAVGGLTGSNTVGLKLTDTTSSTSQTIASQANGSFTFGTALNFGDGWNVTVATQPTGQTCAVANGSGTNLSGNVTTVSVTCTTNTYTIGGAVGGLTGSNTVGLKLTDTTRAPRRRLPRRPMAASPSAPRSTSATAGTSPSRRSRRARPAW
jgi:hypothetical protein